uniref:Uncharacterized protein n=1 Tax=Proboscia inermis TaxID=420281 RepID=A0A7S0C667_9STRA|mmetsp:Transcript_29534/g.29927  ORF Transcript_29534/g.29927 Transcript_29534/m.29927 type:complete len:120 (+) Transcript_29534:138-497(+)
MWFCCVWVVDRDLTDPRTGCHPPLLPKLEMVKYVRYPKKMSIFPPPSTPEPSTCTDGQQRTAPCDAIRDKVFGHSWVLGSLNAVATATATGTTANPKAPTDDEKDAERTHPTDVPNFLW